MFLIVVSNGSRRGVVVVSSYGMLVVIDLLFCCFLISSFLSLIIVWKKGHIFLNHDHQYLLSRGCSWPMGK